MKRLIRAGKQRRRNSASVPASDANTGCADNDDQEDDGAADAPISSQRWMSVCRRAVNKTMRRVRRGAISLPLSLSFSRDDYTLRHAQRARTDVGIGDGRNDVGDRRFADDGRPWPR